MKINSNFSGQNRFRGQSTLPWNSLLNRFVLLGLSFAICVIFVACGADEERSISQHRSDGGDGIGTEDSSGFHLEITKKSSGYLQVKDGNKWKFVYCSSSGKLKVSDSKKEQWAIDGRKLQYDGDLKLDCPEENGGSAAVKCSCNNGGENLHTRLKPGGKSRASFKKGQEQYIGPNSGFQSCLKVIGSRVHSPCNPDSKRSCSESDRFSDKQNEATCDLFRMVR